MNMKYFKDASGGVHGFDIDDAAQVSLMGQLATGWTDITGSWPPVASVAEQAADLAVKIDSDVDAVYREVMGARASEYELAESDAKAYVAAGYTGTVPASVSSWATATGQTDQWAADNIISTANAWRSAQANMRAERLAKKQALKATGITQAIVTQVASDWATFIASVRSQLGL